MSAPVHRHRRRDLFHPFQTSSPSGRTSAHAGCAWTPSTWSSSCQPWNTASPTPTNKWVGSYNQHLIKFARVRIIIECPQNGLFHYRRDIIIMSRMAVGKMVDDNDNDDLTTFLWKFQHFLEKYLLLMFWVINYISLENVDIYQRKVDIFRQICRSQWHFSTFSFSMLMKTFKRHQILILKSIKSTLDW